MYLLLVVFWPYLDCTKRWQEKESLLSDLYADDDTLLATFGLELYRSLVAVRNSTSSVISIPRPIKTKVG
jgi:hypothetical protein